MGEVPQGQPTKYKVEDLIAKKTYKFRIRAVNKIGPSEPGLFGKPVLAKDPWGKRFKLFQYLIYFRSGHYFYVLAI